MHEPLPLIALHEHLLVLEAARIPYPSTLHLQKASHTCVPPLCLNAAEEQARKKKQSDAMSLQVWAASLQLSGSALLAVSMQTEHVKAVRAMGVALGKAWLLAAG